MRSANVWCMCADESSPRVSPLTRTTMRTFVPSSSSAVTMHGPSTLEPSQSFAFPGPMPIGSSRVCVSLADMSFQIVQPKTCVHRVLDADVLSLRSDHAGELELVIESVRVRGPRDLLVGADHGVGHPLVVGGNVEPFGGDVATETRHDVVEVSLERQEVAEAARSQGRKEPSVDHRGSPSDWRAGLDERDHVTGEANVDDCVVFEQADARAVAGLVRHELHEPATAACCTASRIFR